MAYNNSEKKDKYMQKQKIHKILRDKFVSAQKA